MSQSKEADKFFKSFQTGMTSGMYTCSMCRIEAFDPTLMKADIIVLPGGDLVKSVPVHTPQTGEYIIRMPYKKGDLVFAVFARSEIDDIMTGGLPEKSERQFDINDAIVVGGINLFTQPMPDEHGPDLVITKKDFTAKIVIQSDNQIIIETDNDIVAKGARIFLN